MLNNTPELVTAISQPSITTYIAARLNFKNETMFLWTGVGSITAPANTGDALLDGKTFDSISHELIEIGENTFSTTGSGELTVSLNVPADADLTITAAQTIPAEYQGRSAVLWRVVKLVQSDPLAAPTWYFRRIRSGTMDKVEVQADGMSHKFTLTIESHSGKISNATNQTWLNQRQYDPNDSSQDFAPSIANGDPAPTRANTTGVGSSGAGYAGDYGGGYGGYGGGFRNNVALY